MTPKESPTRKPTELPRIVSSLKSDNASHQLSEEPSNKSFSSYKKETHLVLHFDINETILVGDEAGGDSRQDCLNKMIAKSAFVQYKKVHDRDEGTFKSTSAVVPTHWWDGTPMDSNELSSPPPLYTGWQWPPGCCPYYRTSYKQSAKRFVDGDGSVYKPLYHEMERRLTLGDVPNDVLSHMIPALFHTLLELSQCSQRFTLAFRTFGTDLPDVAQAISAFAKGQHPRYLGFKNENLILEPENLYRGRWKRNDRNTVYQLWSTQEELVASGDEEIVNLLESKTVCGIQDDYDFWSQNHWEPWAGKPVWVPSHSSCHHLLLDDNIHNLEHDSIASVRCQQEPDSDYCTLSGKEILEMQGLHLIRVPTIEPIMNPEWFLQQIERAQQARFLATQS